MPIRGRQSRRGGPAGDEEACQSPQAIVAVLVVVIVGEGEGGKRMRRRWQGR